MEQPFETKANVLKLTGRRLMDRYLVEERLARGGMGVVFRGDDERLHRPVCVKVFIPLDPALPEYSTVLEHFVQEAFTLSRLTHPNTLRIYDFGYLNDQARTGPFFVMEFADGGTLTELVEARGELAPAEVLQILEPVVGALAEAHDMGIVHRDIKPSNVLFNLAGGGLIPKLCDFSIAKTTGDFPNRAHDTNTQVPLYSVSWAAPEQLIGGASVGPSADVFALALTTVFMLTGFVLYPAEDLMQTYALRGNGETFRKERLAQFITNPAVLRVLNKACAEKPLERYSSVETFLDELRTAFEEDGRSLEPSPSDLSVVSPLPSPPDFAAYQEEDEHGDDLDTGIHERLGFAAPQAVPTQPTKKEPLLHVVEPDRPPGQAAAPPAEAKRRPPPVVVGPPPRAAAPQPQPAAPPRPAAPAPNRPHVELTSFAQKQVIVHSRRAQLLEAEERVLTFPALDGGENPRIRVTAMDVDGARLHIKGLNCFVRVHGSRASSGIDIKATTGVDLMSLRQSVSAQLGVVVGRRHDKHIVVDLPDFALVVPTAIASWVVVIDSASTQESIVLYRRPNN